MDIDTEEAHKFQDWVQAHLNQPGIASLSYEPNNVVPTGYEFLPCPEGEKPSVGVRVWLYDYDGKVFDVDYSTAYPEFRNGPDDGIDIDTLPEDIRREAWRMGWFSLMNAAAHIISNLQTRLMYQVAEQLGFDIDAFVEKAEKTMPTDLAIQYSVTYLSFLHTRHVLMESGWEERVRGASLMLDMVDEMLTSVRDIVKGDGSD